jgi:DNA-binding LytR/AlgR family response regulator
MISCYIIDDEFHAIENLSDIIIATPGLELIGTATDPLLGFEFITSQQVPDITFLDIHMPKLSGMELASLVKHLTKVVFTTAYDQFAVQAFEKEALDYLLKPITQERFLQCISKYKKQNDNIAPVKEPFFYIRTDTKSKMTRVNLDQITYIEGALNYIIIHLKDGKSEITYLTMGEIEAYLPDKDFSRMHRSFIVNHHQIKSINGNDITLLDKTTLNIGPAYKETFFEKLNKNLIKTKRFQ